MLVFPLLAALVGVVVVADHLRETRSDARFLNLAGRQRMLSVELRSWLNMVSAGQLEDRAGLQERTEAFSSALHRLRHGDSADPRLGPAPAELLPALDAVEAQWQVVVVDLRRVAAGGLGPGAAVSSRTDASMEQLRVRSEALVNAYEARMHRLRANLMLGLGTLLGVVLLVLLAGLVLTRRFLVRPLQQLTAAAGRVRGGDYSIRVRLNSKDELAVLSGAFNEMAEQAGHMLATSEGQRRQAEMIIECVPVIMLVLREDLTVLRSNRGLAATLGLSESDVLGRPVTAFLGGERLRDAVAEVLATRQTRRALLLDGCGSLGERRHMRATLAAMDDGAGPQRLLLVAEDLTQEEALVARAAASETRFNAVVESATDAVVLLDAQGRITYNNAATEKMFGWDGDQLIGRCLAMLACPEGAAPNERTLVAAVPPVGARLLEGRRRDGTVFPVECTVSACGIGGDAAFIGILRDVSTGQVLAAKALEMDRMLAAGTLAAGVAHEINNPLSYVLANLQHVAARMEGLKQADVTRQCGMEAHLDDVISAVNDARDGAERVRRIARDLGTLSRSAEDEPVRPASLVRVLEAAVSLAWNHVRHRAQFTREIGVAPLVDANESKLGQVFLNLLINAAHAIPEGQAGTNEIRVRIRTGDDGDAVVEVHDTGCGIPEELQERIFDPFFTTKPVGQGTGLGLSICKAIIASCGGTLTVRSRVGVGSCFTVTLPPSSGASRGTPGEDAPPDAAARGRILVVDDDPLVAVGLRRILQNDHDVQLADGGRAALAILAEQPFDVILCDLMMPDMTGMDLFAELKRRHPELVDRVVFISGGAFTPTGRAFLDSVNNPRLDKPVDMAALKRVIQQVLAG
ncbi:MAG: PAS domain S-box protein [Deltaproteobacteria bacterium]|nr:PAS domain S-box protein [Deltaproteobacteria bacterium]